MLYKHYFWILCEVKICRNWTSKLWARPSPWGSTKLSPAGSVKWKLRTYIMDAAGKGRLMKCYELQRRQPVLAVLTDALKGTSKDLTHQSLFTNTAYVRKVFIIPYVSPKISVWSLINVLKCCPLRQQRLHITLHVGWSVCLGQRHADCSGTQTCSPLIRRSVHHSTEPQPQNIVKCAQLQYGKMCLSGGGNCSKQSFFPVFGNLGIQICLKCCLEADSQSVCGAIGHIHT